MSGTHQSLGGREISHTLSVLRVAIEDGRRDNVRAQAGRLHRVVGDHGALGVARNGDLGVRASFDVVVRQLGHNLATLGPTVDVRLDSCRIVNALDRDLAAAESAD